MVIRLSILVLFSVENNASIYNQLLLNILRVISQKYGHNL